MPLTIATFAIIAAFCVAFFFVAKASLKNHTKSFMDYKLLKEKEAMQSLNFNLVGPSQAPDPLRQLAKRGFEAMISTHFYAKEYVGDRLNCTNCHFAGGNTSGGPQGGISLVGSATQYPAYSSVDKKVISLSERINNCFTKSMNGKPLPLDSELMMAMVTYLQWISKDLPIYGDIPWLGLEPLTSKHVGNAEQGKQVYEKHCALCHRSDGQGGENNPPLWGNDSFNNAAGMSKHSSLASFVYWNMPYNETTPMLTEEEALDVAAYILTKPRAKAKDKG